MLNKKKVCFVIIIVCIIIFSVFSRVLGNEEIEEEITYDYYVGVVNTEQLRLRTGLSTENMCIGKLKKGEKLHIYDKINDWYIVKTENDIVGTVFSKYVELDSPEVLDVSNNILLTENENQFLELINQYRLENGLGSLKIDEKILNVARLKCQDMVKNNYFSHVSDQYGSLYELLTNCGIKYSFASENIVKADDIETAVKLLVNSKQHEENIVNSQYNATGISVEKNNFGKYVCVQVFAQINSDY